MKNSFGNNVTVTLFGESHGECVGAVLDGLSSGIEISEEYIAEKMMQRRSVSSLSTPRIESDKVKFLSGVYNGFTTGTPITVVIENENKISSDYEKTKFIPRPGHADLSGYIKYGGYNDMRGGGHFSGRVTSGLVAVGAICEYALQSKGILIGSHIKRLAGINDRDFGNIRKDIELLNKSDFAVLDESSSKEMQEKITEAKNELDSVGGIIESAVIGMPEGIGEPWFDTLESTISHILFSIPGVKGVEFGDGFSLADMKGSESNGSYRIENGKVKLENDKMGGIYGGISSGTPVIIRTGVKPTPSISKLQKSVNIKTMEEESLEIHGRHDPCIVHRARAVVDSAIAIALADALETKFGCDYFRR